MKKEGYALVLDDGKGHYTMSTVHKTKECALENGLGGIFACLNAVRVVAVVPVEFEDNGQDLNYYWGDNGTMKKDSEEPAVTTESMNES